jgi:hypothetical protein
MAIAEFNAGQIKAICSSKLLVARKVLELYDMDTNRYKVGILSVQLREKIELYIRIIHLCSYSNSDIIWLSDTDCNIIFED